MIIICEKCTTSFQLDDARVPEKGVRVRCSRCRHGFFVKPETPTDDDPVDRAVEHALTAEASEDAAAPDEVGGLEASPFGEAGEADWQFNHDAEGGHDAALAAAQDTVDELLGANPSESLDAQTSSLESEDVEDDIDALLGGATPAAAAQVEAPAAPVAEAAEQPRAPEPEEELGSPDEWDFGSDARNHDEEEREPGKVALARVELVPAGSLEPLHEPETDTEPPRLATWMRHVGNVIGWTATAALGGAVFYTTLQPVPAAIGPATASGPGVELVDVAARRVDNLVAGPVTVIEGRFEPAARAQRPSGTRFAVRLFDARGALLSEDAATLGPALPATALREEDPALLRDALERGALAAAWRVAPARGSQPFHAVIQELPAGAARFDLAVMPAARPPGPAIGSAAAQESD